MAATKTCPFCAETIPQPAVRCPYCRTDLPHPVAPDVSPEQAAPLTAPATPVVAAPPHAAALSPHDPPKPVVARITDDPEAEAPRRRVPPRLLIGGGVGVAALAIVLFMALRSPSSPAPAVVVVQESSKVRTDDRRHVVVGEVKFIGAVGDEAAAFRDQLVRIARSRGAEVVPVKQWHDAGGKSSWASLTEDVDRSILTRVGLATDTDAIVTAEIAPGDGLESRWVVNVKVLKAAGGADRNIVIRHGRADWGLSRDEMNQLESEVAASL
jgi:hypothetical protein